MKGRITKRAKHLGLFAAVVSGLFVLVIAFGLSSRQPSYRGHSLEYWFHRLPLILVVSTNQVAYSSQVHMPGRDYGSRYEEADQAVLAIEAIGTNGLPFILGKLQYQQAPMQRWVQVLAWRCGLKRMLFPVQEFERGQAVRALVTLAPLPPDAVLQLCHLSQNTNSVGLSAAYVLKVNANPGSKPFLGGGIMKLSP
jgi:hypothetical protein